MLLERRHFSRQKSQQSIVESDAPKSSLNLKTMW